MKAAIIGIEKHDKQKIYRVITFKRDGTDWKFTGRKLDERRIIQAIEQGLEFINATVERGRLKGKTGDLARFENGVNKPMVILAEIVTDKGEVLGYKMSNYDGIVKNISLRNVLAYCNREKVIGGIPIQNAIYVPGEGAENRQSKSFIRCYNEGDFIQEVIVRKRAETAVKPKIYSEKNKKAISRLEELFNKEQIEQLKLGKKNGVNIKIYGDNKLEAEQMKVIREALEEKLNARLFADPRYSVDIMRYLRAELKHGVDISYFLNPDYSIGQLAELSNGYISGVDITKYANPNINAEEMAEIRLRLERNIWKEHSVDKDNSWQ